MEISIAPVQLAGFSHRYDTGSQPMVLFDMRGDLFVVKFAEKVERSTAGLAREYLAGSLAEIIDAPVPSTTFVQLTPATLLLDSNIAFADGSRPAPQITVGSTYVANAASPANPMVFETIPDVDLAGVFIFNTWVSVGDRHWGNYIIETTTVGPRLISVDYATCLSVDRSTPTSIGDPDLVPFLQQARDALDLYLHRLQAVTEDRIRGAIARIPSAWMDYPERERVVNFLLQGREATAQLIGASLP